MHERHAAQPVLEKGQLRAGCDSGSRRDSPFAYNAIQEARQHQAIRKRRAPPLRTAQPHSAPIASIRPFFSWLRGRKGMQASSPRDDQNSALRRVPVCWPHSNRKLSTLAISSFDDLVHPRSRPNRVHGVLDRLPRRGVPRERHLSPTCGDGASKLPWSRAVQADFALFGVAVPSRRSRASSCQRSAEARQHFVDPRRGTPPRLLRASHPRFATQASLRPSHF